MKRNENLKTLSWEHHDGLVVCFRLQQGLKSNINYKEMAEYVLHTWNNVLKHHFWQEEQILSQKKNNTKKSSECITQMQDDHKKIRELITKIDNNSETKLIGEFAELLNNHIRFEERELFPLLENESSTNDLKEIGKFLKQHHNNSCEVWPNHFWKIDYKSN